MSTDEVQLREFRAECDKVGIPYDAAGLVRHHRGGAAVAAGAEAFGKVLMAERQRDSWRAVVLAVQTDAEFVETTWKLKEPDPLSDWRKGVEWMIGRTRNVITDGLAAAADAPQPETKDQR